MTTLKKCILFAYISTNRLEKLLESLFNVRIITVLERLFAYNVISNTVIRKTQLREERLTCLLEIP